jgi:hypothetical protein
MGSAPRWSGTGSRWPQQAIFKKAAYRRAVCRIPLIESFLSRQFFPAVDFGVARIAKSGDSPRVSLDPSALAIAQLIAVRYLGSANAAASLARQRGDMAIEACFIALDWKFMAHARCIVHASPNM